MGYSRKIQTGNVEDILFENPLEFFIFLIYPWDFQNKAKLNPSIFHKIVLVPIWKFQCHWPKRQTTGNSTLFLLAPLLRNSTSFLINPWKFHMLFLWYPWKFPILNPTCLDFFCGIAQFSGIVHWQCNGNEGVHIL